MGSRIPQPDSLTHPKQDLHRTNNQDKGGGSLQKTQQGGLKAELLGDLGGAPQGTKVLKCIKALPGNETSIQAHLLIVLRHVGF